MQIYEVEGYQTNLLIPAVATLIFGILIGYIGQRSGMCIPNGMRDIYLIKNTYLFKALLGLIAGAYGGFIIFKSIGVNMPNFLLLLKSPGLDSPLSVALTFIGGLGLGFFSFLAGGCPFRQHVLASEGRGNAMGYLAGFYVGIIYFYIVVIKLIAVLITLIR